MTFLRLRISILIANVGGGSNHESSVMLSSVYCGLLLSSALPLCPFCSSELSCEGKECNARSLKNMDDAAPPPPLYFPPPTIKSKLQKKHTRKWWPVSEAFPRVEPCGQILARAILERLGYNPSLFSVGNKVHVLEAVSLTFLSCYSNIS